MNSQEMIKTASEKPGVLFKNAANVGELFNAAKRLGINTKGKGAAELKQLVSKAGGGNKQVLNTAEIAARKAPVASQAGALSSDGKDILRGRAELASANRRPVINDAMKGWDASNPAPAGSSGVLGIGKRPPSAQELAQHRANRNIEMANVHNQNFKTMPVSASVGGEAVAPTGAMSTFKQKAGEVWNNTIKPNSKLIAGTGAAGLVAGHVLARNNNQPRPAYAY